MLKFLKIAGIILLSVIILIIIIYFAGPKMSQPSFSDRLPQVETSVADMNDFVRNEEASAGAIKPDNEAQIIWYDSIPKQTKYAVVYVHGFGASQGEGSPVHQHLADSLKANLYLARLARHGLVKQDAFAGITAEEYMNSAMEALAIGKQIGEQVILVGTSTGASQAIYLAAKLPDKIAALVLYSPFIELADANLQMLSTGPWSEKIARAMLGDSIIYTERPDSVAAYWSSYYHPDAYIALFAMVQYTMVPEVFNAVKVPVFMAYYYKDEEHQDDVVSVSAQENMFEQLNVENKKSIAFPEAGDHVIASRWRSNDWQAVEDSTLKFLAKILEY